MTSETHYRKVKDAPGYLVSNDGRIFTQWKNIPPSAIRGQKNKAVIDVARRVEMKQELCKRSGYWRVKLRGADGRRKWHRVNRIVTIAFHGDPPSSEHQSCHEDGNKNNNRASNLYWGTPQQNSDDRRRHGTIRQGIDHPKACLSSEELAFIREWSSNGWSKPLIAATLSRDGRPVSEAVIRDFLAGRTYKLWGKE